MPDYPGRSPAFLRKQFDAIIYETTKMRKTKIKTQDLLGPALDWAAGVALGEKPLIASFEPIIEREKIALWPDCEDATNFFASVNEGGGEDYQGSSYLIAAMRAFVASKLGEEVDIPEELL